MAMRREEYDDERQHECISKYNKIVNKFDELINMVDKVTEAAPKCGRGSSSKSRIVPKRGAHERSTDHINGNTSSSINADDNHVRGQVLSQFITNHLLELKSSPNHSHNKSVVEVAEP